MTSAERHAALLDGLRAYVIELREEARNTALILSEVLALQRTADELERRFLSSSPPMDAKERAGYVNRWEAGAQGKGVDRG
jgi:hypothetical protein